MPQRGYSSIRSQSASLNLSKGGSTSYYVDQNHSAASDNNDGFAWDRPKETITAALLDADPWAEVYISSGSYDENIVVPYENMRLHGVVHSGSDRVEIAPSAGVPLTINAGYFELEGVSLIATNANCVNATAPGHKIHDCYLEVDSDGSAQYTGILLDDCDSFEVSRNSFSGVGALDSIGVRVDGTTNASVDGLIEKNYFLNFGAVGIAGHGVNLSNAQRCLITKNIFDSGYNGVYLGVYANSLHSIVGNQFYANAGVDVADMNPSVIDSGNFIRNNFFGYVGWYNDVNHDGIADVAIQCGYNYDYAPLASPHFLGPSFVPRVVA